MPHTILGSVASPGKGGDSQAGNPWRLLFSRAYRAELLVGASVAFFSQINGAPWLLVYTNQTWGPWSCTPGVAGCNFCTV